MFGLFREIGSCIKTNEKRGAIFKGKKIYLKMEQDRFLKRISPLV